MTEKNEEIVEDERQQANATFILAAVDPGDVFIRKDSQKQGIVVTEHASVSSDSDTIKGRLIINRDDVGWKTTRIETEESFRILREFYEYSPELTGTISY